MNSTEKRRKTKFFWFLHRYEGYDITRDTEIIRNLRAMKYIHTFAIFKQVIEFFLY